MQALTCYPGSEHSTHGHNNFFDNIANENQVHGFELNNASMDKPDEQHRQQ